MSEKSFTFQDVTPYLHYEDGAAMIEWLSRVLGFQERSRFVDNDGRVAEAEMAIGGSKLWFAGHAPGYWAGKGRGPEQLTLIWVDDVDAHNAHVRSAGVQADLPQDETYGVRSYTVTDPEGYTWGFMTALDTGYVQAKPIPEDGLQETPAPGR